MTIFFIKSLLSLPLILSAGVGMYAMFELFGRGTATVAIDRYKRVHRVAGYIYLVLFFLISYLCTGFMATSKAELSPRAVLHAILALAIIILFLLKVLFVRVYRQFYAQAKIIGIMVGVMSFVLVGITAGYYLTITGFGRDLSVDKSVAYALRGPFLAVVKTERPGTSAVRTDPYSIKRGRTIFSSRCALCHDPLSVNTIIGPGLKGVLKNRVLPISKNPATAESIRFQLRQPMGRMPSFAYLPDDEINDLIAYLNTL